MFGSGVPVCAAYFPAICELVHHNQNGLIFKSSKELESQLAHLLYPKYVFSMSSVVGKENLDNIDNENESIISVKGTNLNNATVHESATIYDAENEFNYENESDIVFIDDDFVHVKRGNKSNHPSASYSNSLMRSNSPQMATASSGSNFITLNASVSIDSVVKATEFAYSFNENNSPQQKLDPMNDLDRLRLGVKLIESWDSNWTLIMAPFIRNLMNAKSKSNNINNYAVACVFVLGYFAYNWKK